MEQKEATPPDTITADTNALDPTHVLGLIREHIDAHEKSRTSVQEDIKTKCSATEDGLDQVRATLHKGLETASGEESDRVLRLARELEERLSKEGSADELQKLVEDGINTLQRMNKYEIKQTPFKTWFAREPKDVLSLDIVSMPSTCSNGLVNDGSREAAEAVCAALKKEANELDTRRVAAADYIEQEYGKLVEDLTKLKSCINGKLEEYYTIEDRRLQELVNKANKLIEKVGSDGSNAIGISKACEEVSADLIFEQDYAITQNWDATSFANCYSLNKKLSIWKLEERKPKSVVFREAKDSKLFFDIEYFTPGELNALKRLCGETSKIKTQIEFCEDGADAIEPLFVNPEDSSVTSSAIKAETTYTIRTKVEFNNKASGWSDGTEIVTPAFAKLCAKKGTPEKIRMNVPLEEQFKNIRKRYTTMIWNTALPLNKVTSWSIKILKSQSTNGKGVFAGVAPFDIEQMEEEHYGMVKCGWYINCGNLSLMSTSSCQLKKGRYVPYNERLKCVNDGDSVGVVMDTTKGELSFVVGGVNFGVAYEGIPLDKPLIPCVFLYNKEDTIELDASEVKENVSSTIPVPSNITSKCATWDSITLSWDANKAVTFYQIEMNGIFCAFSSENTFTKAGLLPDKEHTFRVRAVCGNEVSEWSEPITGKTQDDVPPFRECAWRKPESYYSDCANYCLSLNSPLVVTNKLNGHSGHAIGTAPFPPNQVTVWGAKIIKGCSDITVGIIPFDAIECNPLNIHAYGWHLNCYHTTVFSGPPQSCPGKAYGPKKIWDSIKKGGVVWVAVDVAKGELSFVVDDVNLGVAFEGIPLDKPLVPCVTISCKGDSVKLCFPPAQEGDDGKKHQCVIS